MENPEEVLTWLEDAARRRPTSIPRELDEYLAWVARTGEPVYQWQLVRPLLKEKLTQVLQEFRASGPPPPTCAPNVPPFDADAMRTVALARLDAFQAPPFTVQRICELLAHPRKHYNRLDKFMRAFEKNVLVVSTKEPEPPRRRSSPQPQPLTQTPTQPQNSYEDDEEEHQYPRTLNGPLVRNVRPEPSSSSSTERLTPERDGGDSEEKVILEDEEEKSSSETFASKSPIDDDYDRVNPGVDAERVDDLPRFSPPGDDTEDVPIVNDDGDNATDVKSEDEVLPGAMDPASPASPRSITPTEESSDENAEVQNVDECAQDDSHSDEINVDNVESDSTLSPPNGLDGESSCPMQTQESEGAVESFENLIERSVVLSPVERVDVVVAPVVDDITETEESAKSSVCEDVVKVHDVAPVGDADAPTPMDCTEQEEEEDEKEEKVVESPVVPSSVEEVPVADVADEGMVTEDSAPSSEVGETPSQE